MTEQRPASSGAPSQVRVRRVQVAGRHLVAKSATGRRRSELRREAELLRHLQQRHVIDLTALRETDDRTDMITSDAGNHTLSNTASMCPEMFFAALIATAAAVADLHEAGWSHGAICADHIVVDDAGGVTLCSLGTATMHGADDTAAAGDLLQLRAVIDTGLRHSDDNWSHAERRRWRLLTHRARRRIDERRPRGSGEALPAGALAESLRSAGASSRPPAPAPRQARAPARLTRTPATLVTAVCVVGVAALIWATMSSPSGVASAQPSPQLSSPAPPTTTSLPATTSRPAEPTTTSAPPEPPEPPPPRPRPRPEEVSVTGNEVRAGGMTFWAGTDGDRLAVVDPDCTGTARVMLLRPSTGQLFEFSGWPSTGRPARARLHSVHPGAVDLETIEPATIEPATINSATSNSGIADPAGVGLGGEAERRCRQLVLRYSDDVPQAAPTAPSSVPVPAPMSESEGRPPANQEEP